MNACSLLCLFSVRLPRTRAVRAPTTAGSPRYWRGNSRLASRLLRDSFPLQKSRRRTHTAGPNTAGRWLSLTLTARVRRCRFPKRPASLASATSRFRRGLSRARWRSPAPPRLRHQPGSRRSRAPSKFRSRSSAPSVRAAPRLRRGCPNHCQRIHLRRRTHRSGWYLNRPQNPTKKRTGGDAGSQSLRWQNFSPRKRRRSPPAGSATARSSGVPRRVRAALRHARSPRMGKACEAWKRRRRFQSAGSLNQKAHRAGYSPGSLLDSRLGSYQSLERRSRGRRARPARWTAGCSARSSSSASRAARSGSSYRPPHRPSRSVQSHTRSYHHRVLSRPRWHTRRRRQNGLSLFLNPRTTSARAPRRAPRCRRSRRR